MAEQIEFEIAVEGADQASTGVRGVAEALGGAGRAAVDSSPQLQRFAQAAGQMGGAVGQIGGMLGRVNPQLGGFVQAVGQAGSAIGAMTTAAGPLGLALAAVSAALAITTAAQIAFADETDDARRASDEHAASIRDLAEAFREVNAVQNAFAGTNTATGDISSMLTERTDAIRTLRGEIASFREELTDEQISAMDRAGGPEAMMRLLGPAGGLIGAGPLQEMVDRLHRIRDIEREMEELQEGLGRAGESMTGRTIAPGMPGSFGSLSSVAEEAEEGARRSGGRRGAANDNDPFSDAAIAERMARDEAYWREQRIQGLEEEAAARRAFNQEVMDAAQAQDDADKAAAVARRERLEEEHQLRIDMLEQEKEKAREAAQQVEDDAMGVLGPVVKGLTESIAQVVAGTKSADEAFQGMLASFLEMIAQQAALEAAKQFAYAIASFASEDYAGGALHLAAGAAFTGVAIAAGAASVAVAPQAAAPASPQQSSNPQEQGAGSVTINYQAGIFVRGDQAESGREIDELVRQGQRRFAA